MASIKATPRGQGKGARGKLYNNEAFYYHRRDENWKSRDHATQWRRQETPSRRTRADRRASVATADDSDDLASEDATFLTKCVEQNVLLEGLIILAARKHSIATVLQKAEHERDNLDAMSRFGDVDGDAFTVINAMRAWANELRTRISAGPISDWLVDNRLDGKKLETIEQEVQRMYDLLQKTRASLAKLNFRANIELAKNSLVDILLSTFGKDLGVYTGHDALGYRKLGNGTLVRASRSSILQVCTQRPQYIIPLVENTEPTHTDKLNHRVVFSRPSIAVEGSLLVAVSPQLVHEYLRSKQDKACEDVNDKAMLRRTDFADIGRIGTERLVRRWTSQKANNLGQKIQDRCGRDLAIVAELHPVTGNLQVWCAAAHQSVVRDVVEAEMAEIRESLAAETVSLPYPDPQGQARVNLGPGLQCQSFIFPGESLMVIVKAIPGVDITWADVLTAVNDLPGVVSVSESENTTGDVVLGYLTLNSADNLRHLLDECQRRAWPFLVTQHAASDSDNVADAPFHFSDDLSVSIVWRVHTDRYSKPRVSERDVAKVRATICRVLDSLAEDKVTVHVTSGNQDRKRGVVRAQVCFVGHITSQRGFEMVKELVSGDLPVEIDNIEEVNTRLRTLTVYINTHVFKVLGATVMAKLENYRRSAKYGAAFELKPSGNNTMCLRLTASTQPAFMEIRTRLRETLTPHSMTLSRSDACRMATRSGEAFIRLVMIDTNTYITMPALSNQLLVFGNRTNRTAAIEQVQAMLSEESHLDFIINPQTDGLPNDFLLCMAPTLRKYYLNANEIFVPASMGFSTRQDGIEDLIKSSVKTSKLSSSSAPDQSVDSVTYRSCVSCFTDLVSGEDCYVLEGCGHVYCLECIRTQIVEAINTTSYPVLCAHDNQPFSANDILNIVGRMKLVSVKRMLFAAVREFVGRNSDIYRFCSRTNCPGMCRRQQTQLVDCMACCLCSKKICPKCMNSYHKFLTCEQAASDTFRLQEWIAEAPKSRKKCPFCKIGIEKMDGCNRVTCGFCNKNICWVCLKYFVTSRECYDHLNKEHGGYGF